MSVKVDENNIITMTRGDTALFTVTMTWPNGDECIPGPNDSVRFAMKSPKLVGGKQYKDQEPLLLIDIPSDTMALEISPEDTKQFDFGKYMYDIEVTFADGTVDTFIEPPENDTGVPTPNFILTPEVH